MPQARSRVTNGMQLFLTRVDGRTVEARRFRDVFAQLVIDLGGDPTEAQLALVRRAATLAVWCEKQEVELAKGAKRGAKLNVQAYTTVVNTLRRLLATLGLERKLRDITPRNPYGDGAGEPDAFHIEHMDLDRLSEDERRELRRLLEKSAGVIDIRQSNLNGGADADEP